MKKTRRLHTFMLLCVWLVVRRRFVFIFRPSCLFSAVYVRLSSVLCRPAGGSAAHGDLTPNDVRGFSCLNETMREEYAPSFLQNETSLNRLRWQEANNRLLCTLAEKTPNWRSEGREPSGGGVHRN